MIDKADKMTLLETPAFRRFLFDLIQSSGIFEASTNGTDGRNLFAEGRRSLGLEVLRSMDEAQPVQSPTGIPILTLIQTLHEEAQSAPKEKPLARRNGPYTDLGDSDGDDR
jgi:hypothetical protein